MPVVSTPAVILQGFPYGDTSRILRLYTRDFGLRSVIAKGAARPRSRFGGLLEPFTEGQAQFFLREGRDLFILSGFDLLRGRQRIGHDLAAFAGASLAAELLLRGGTEEPHPELFDTFSASLDGIARAEPEEIPARALAAVWLVVALLGYRPELEVCVRCGRSLEPDESCRFDVEAGGAACLVCRPAGRLLDPRTRAEILAMSGGEPPVARPEGRTLHRALLQVFLSTHLAHDRPLRALDLFADQLR